MIDNAKDKIKHIGERAKDKAEIAKKDLRIKQMEIDKKQADHKSD